MGAWIYTEVLVGKDVKEIYADAVEEALYEHGHDPYNGTISTTDLDKVIPHTDMPRAGTKAWNKAIEKLMETTEKGSCVAVEIKPGSKVYKHYKNYSPYKGKKGVKVYKFVIAARS